MFKVSASIDDDDIESSKGTPESKSKRPLSEGSKVITNFSEVLPYA